MNRREFVKCMSVAIAGIAFIPTLPIKSAVPKTKSTTGVSQEQLRGLIRVTLEDLPQGSFNTYPFTPYEVYEWKRLYQPISMR